MTLGFPLTLLCLANSDSFFKNQLQGQRLWATFPGRLSSPCEVSPTACSVPRVSTYILHSNPVPPPPRDLRAREEHCPHVQLHCLPRGCCPMQADLVLLCFTLLHCFYKLKACGNPVSSKSTRVIFPTAFAPFMSLYHILVILTISQTFSLLLYVLG